MIAAAVAKTRLSAAQPGDSEPLDKIVLVLGSGEAATVCREALSAQNIQALQLRDLPRQIRQTPDHFTALMDNATRWTGSAVILAPRDDQEHAQIISAFKPDHRQPRILTTWGAVDTHRPGVFTCDVAAEPHLAGLAAAARACAWLGYQHPWPEPPTYRVDPERCRGCGDCEQVCEFGAIQLQEDGEIRVAWIDPWICQGGGTCATRCPAGAIKTERVTSMQIDAMLEALLA
jgi:ferredoxin